MKKVTIFFLTFFFFSCHSSRRIENSKNDLNELREGIIRCFESAVTENNMLAVAYRIGLINPFGTSLIAASVIAY